MAPYDHGSCTPCACSNDKSCTCAFALEVGDALPNGDEFLKHLALQPLETQDGIPADVLHVVDG